MKLKLKTPYISISNILSRFYRGDHELEFVPLQRQKNEIIEVEEVIKRHDKRVAAAFEQWKTTIFTILLIFCFSTVSQAALTNKYDRMFKRYAILHGISPKWSKAVSIAESALNPNAVSWVGARGLMQFMPGTWEWMAKGYLKELGPLNPRAAIWVGSKYLRWNRDRVPDADIADAERLASASYNSGWGNVRKARAVCRALACCCSPNIWYNHVESNLVTSAASQEETRTYVRRIDRWKKRKIL